MFRINNSVASLTLLPWGRIRWISRKQPQAMGLSLCAPHISAAPGKMSQSLPGRRASIRAAREVILEAVHDGAGGAFVKRTATQPAFLDRV